MLFLIALIIAVFTALILDKPLKKHPTVFYVAAGVLTAVSIIILQSGIEISSRFVREYVIGIFSRGALGAAFWAVVMWAGALPNGSATIKKLMPVRGELSIIAAIITMSHIITYGLQYISDFVKGRTGSGFAVTSIICIIMILIMIPLTVMSFKTVRRKMNAKTWKKIQRFAYVFYTLIYIHIMVLFVPKARNGKDGYFLSVIVYSVVFIGYAAMRIRKYIYSKKSNMKLVSNVVTLCAVALTLVIAASASPGTKHEDAPTGESAAVFTFAAGSTATEETSTSSAVTTETTAVTSVSDTAADTDTETSVTSAESTMQETTEISTETAAASEEVVTEEQHDEQPEQVQPDEPQPEPEPEPEITYKYRNGEYEADADGYAGKVHVKLTIENDVITSISAWADDDDPEYFGDAMNTVIPQIASNVSSDGIDTCSGATYSSKGIIEAARKALEQAMN